MEFRNGQVAVTGASGGIGRALCAHLAGLGLSVFALDRVAPEPLTGVAFVSVDVTDPSSVEAAAATVYESAAGPVDLVCCAGIVEDDVAAEDMAIELFDSVLSVNLRGLFLSCQAFGRQLLARGGGSIVNIASMSGNYVVNFPQHQCAYNASKAAVTALSKSLAVEWGPRGVRVNAVSPGLRGHAAAGQENAPVRPTGCRGSCSTVLLSRTRWLEPWRSCSVPIRAIAAAPSF